MNRICSFIVKKRMIFCILFAAALIASAACMPYVRVNYDDTKYLPDSSNTKAGFLVMEGEFGGVGTAQAMLDSGDIEEVLRIKAEIQAVEGVESVIWLDSIFLPLAEDTGLSDSQVVELFLRLLEALPEKEDTTPYGLALALKSRFSEDELTLISGSLGNMLPDGGNEFDIERLMALTEPLPDEYLSAARALAGQVGGASDIVRFLPGFIDALVAVNMSGRLSAGQALTYLMQAIACLPSAEGTTFYDIYSALAAAFTTQELPVVMQLLSSLGMDFSGIDLSDPQVLMMPVPAESLAAISAAKESLTSLEPVLSDGGMLPAIIDYVILLNLKGVPLSGGDALYYLERLSRVLPTGDGAAVYDLLLALTREFSGEELAYILPLLGEFYDGDISWDADAGDLMRVSSPLGAGYADIVNGFHTEVGRLYKDGHALFSIAFSDGDYAEATSRAVGEIVSISEKLHLFGNATHTYYERQDQRSEMLRATALAVIVALVILLIFSSSWFEPLLYIAAIASAIILNMGSNLLLGDVSYLTQNVASILQLALSIDYAVFLINRYKRERAGGVEAEEAMTRALRGSLAPILASSLTTVACFVTVIFMKYKLGFDMGVVMAKGIILSFLTVFLFLPGLVVYSDKLIIKSEHKALKLGTGGLSRFSVKYRWVVVVLAFALIVPAAYLAGQNTFTYGRSATLPADSKVLENRRAAEEVFGTQEQLAVLVPKNYHKELVLGERLAGIDRVVSVVSWAQMADSGMNTLLPDVLKAQFTGRDKFNRVLLYLECEEEGDEAREMLSAVRQTVSDVYGSDEFYLLGNTAAAADIEEHTSVDFNRITAYSIAAVAAVVALSFSSALIPVMLVAVIEGAIWINMSIPYLLGEHMVFVGYLIISNILLGATIDYAILLTSNYLEARKKLDEAGAVAEAQSTSLRSILTSGSIFAVGGLILGLTSSFPTVRMLGHAIMRGGICAVIMTVFVLPALLIILDKPIRFLTKKGK